MAKETITKFVPSLILAGDIHAGNLQPECREDNYLDALCKKLEWIRDLQAKYKCPVIFPGDIFNSWSADSALLNRIMLSWPNPEFGVYAVPGQHDLPQHNLENQYKTAFETMCLAGKMIDVCRGEVGGLGELFSHGQFGVCGCAWGREPCDHIDTEFPVLVRHVTTWEKPFAPGQKPGDATRLLKSLKDWDLIVTGDNHQTFVVADGRRKLINAGSLMRMRSDQIDHKPCVFLWEAATGNIKQAFIPITPGVISDKKRKEMVAREERENAFVAKIEAGADIAFSFQDNVYTLLKDEDAEVKRTVLECIGL